MQDQPPEVSRADGVDLPDASAPNPDLRAARNEIQAIGATLREALDADDALAAGAEPGPGEVRR